MYSRWFRIVNAEELVDIAVTSPGERPLVQSHLRDTASTVCAIRGNGLSEGRVGGGGSESRTPEKCDAA